MKISSPGRQIKIIAILITIVLVCLVIFLLIFFNKWGVGMDKQIMMQVTETDGPYFDATKWFTNGKYKRRKDVQMGKEFYSDCSMLRVAPPPFEPKDNDDILRRAAGAIERSYPTAEKDGEYLLEKRPDLRHRMLYIASGFDAPNQPFDGYQLYLTIGERRYTIDFSRDGVSGKIVDVGSARLIKKDNEKDMKIFSHFEEQESKLGK